MSDILGLDLNLLRALDALLDERSVTRAANRLALTQPAVSGLLARLRERFDDPLFVRGRRGVTPTPRALALAAPVKRILADVEALVRPVAFDPAEATFTLSIAATDYALQAVVAPFLPRLRALAPGVRVRARPIETADAPTLFERGELDIALSTPSEALPELHARRLFEEHYVVVARADHPRIGPDGVTLEDFCALDHALVSYGGDSFRGVADEALARVGASRRVTLSLSSFLVLADVLRTTDLIAVVPSRLANAAPGLRACRPPVEIPGFIKMAVWHERTHADPAQRWARGLLFSTY
ncbi:MAG: LysR family transcriptional regulator, partial [Caulobacter sp.]